MHSRFQRLGAQTARFFHTGLEGTRRFAYHAAREVPRVARIVDAEVLQPLSRAAKVVGSVADAGHLGNSGLKDAASSFSRGMESYDALRQTVLGSSAGYTTPQASQPSPKRVHADLE